MIIEDLDILFKLSRPLGILHPAHYDLDDKVDDLNPTHDGEAGEEAEGAADHWDLGHHICLGVLEETVNTIGIGEGTDLGDEVKGGAVKIDVHNM